MKGLKGLGGFGGKPMGAPKAMSSKGASGGQVHPAALKTRVRLPDSGSIGADQAPIVPNAGRI